MFALASLHSAKVECKKKKKKLKYCAGILASYYEALYLQNKLGHILFVSAALRIYQYHNMLKV